MTKIIVHVIIFLVVAWVVISSFTGNPTDEHEKNEQAITQLPALMLAGLYAGAMFVIYILPALTDKATNAVLHSGQEIEKDPLNDARAACARGDYEEAIKVYRKVTKKDPLNRLPWVEIVQIQLGKLDDPAAAAVTLNKALENHEWSDDDAAYFMGRLSELYLDDLEDQDAALTVLQQMVERFPETRFSANANHKITQINQAIEAS